MPSSIFQLYTSLKYGGILRVILKQHTNYI